MSRSTNRAPSIRPDVPPQTPPDASASTSPAPSAPQPAKKAKRKETWRETIESLNGALILAILIRGFAAEAFVIPTGSMAPTLMGRHKDISCPECGHRFAVNASERSDMVEDAPAFSLSGPGGARRDGPLYATCQNCRFSSRIADDPTHNGDRILVMKAPYLLPALPGGGPPKRWEVIVFHYPENPETNYIKRLVGLPGEEIRIHAGDILARTSPGDPFRLAPKPWRHLRSMRQLVYDDALRPKSLTGLPEWKRWSPEPEGGCWSEDGSGTYRSRPAAKGILAYRHLVPDPDQWAAIADKKALPRPPRATLITDYASYNSGQASTSSWEEASWFQPHWVGDLTLSARVEDHQPGGTGSLDLELVRAGVIHRCRLTFAGKSWHAALFAGDRQVADGDLGAGTWHDLTFANFDGRLNLISDGTPVFGEDGVAVREEDSEVQGPTAEDLRPARIAVEGADVSVSRLAIHRDLYYTQRPGRESDYDGNWERAPRTAVELFDLLSDSANFGIMAKTPASEYPLGGDRYMMLGDNSPRSSDSRAWRNRDHAWDPTESRQRWEVPEEFLVGKAFFIYWPHGVPFGPTISVYLGGREMQIPFRPYVERMTLIR